MSFGNYRSFCVCLLGMVLGLWPSALKASDKIYSMDESRRQILQVQIPWMPKVLLGVDSLASEEVGLEKNSMSFQRIVLSPDPSVLAFIVQAGSQQRLGLFHISENRSLWLSPFFDFPIQKLRWEDSGKYLVLDRQDTANRSYIEIFNLEQNGFCHLEGRHGKDKYYNFYDPWWSSREKKVYFKVSYNNQYRQFLGLKPKSVAAKIGESDLQCNHVELYSVVDFMKRFPQFAEHVEETKILSPMVEEGVE